MARSFLSLLALALLAAHVSSTALPAVDRIVELADIEGTFALRVFVGSTCPNNIQHGTPNPDAVPHSEIVQNGNACDDGGSLSILTMEEALEAAASEEGRSLIEVTSDVDGGALYAVEIEGRTCAGSTLSPGSVIVFLNPPNDISIGEFLELPGNSRYMIIQDPAITSTCIYNAMPRVVMTPTPADSMTMAPSPGAGEGTAPTPDMTGDPTPSAAPGDGGPVAPGGGTGGDGATESPDGSDGDGDSMETPVPTATVTTAGTSPDGDDDDDDDDSPCFPAHATVELEDGTIKAMDQVELGDRLKVADGQFSDVYMFTHKDAETKHDFVKIDTYAGKALTATRGHYIYINNRLAAAGSAKSGDVVELGNGFRTEISKVSIVKSVGLYNPQTIHGDIIVNGVRSSTFTRTVEPATAQALLTPFRMLYDAFGWSTAILDNGAEMIAQVLPKGQVEL